MVKVDQLEQMGNSEVENEHARRAQAAEVLIRTKLYSSGGTA